MLCLLFSGKETPIAAPVTLPPASTSTAAVVVAAAAEAEAEVITTASNNMVAAECASICSTEEMIVSSTPKADKDEFNACIEDTGIMDIRTAMKTLQLSEKTTTLGTIKSRHRFLIKKYHPDKNVNVSNDEEKIELAKMFRKVHRAYKILEKYYKHQQNDQQEYIERETPFHSFCRCLPYNNFCRRLSMKLGTDLNLLENSSNERKRKQIEESNELTSKKSSKAKSNSSSSSTSKRPTKKLKVDHRRSSRLSGTSKLPGGVLNDKWLEKMIKVQKQ